MAFEASGVESKELKVNLKKTEVMVSSSKGEVPKSKVDPCAKGGKRVMTNSVMCTKCGKWVQGTNKKVLFVNYVLIQWKELWNQVKKYHF